MAETLRQVVIVYETEAEAAERLGRCGYTPDIAAEIAVYLAQATDLPEHMSDLVTALAAEGIAARFVPLDALAPLLPELAAARGETLVWNLTDGVRFYRGSAVPALARLLDLPRFGSPPTAQHICQDKFATLALATAAGLPCPPTWLLEGTATLARLGEMPAAGPFFVKPNTLGAKLGIFADSRCATREEAATRAARLWERYGDRALVQPYLAGDDVRVSFLDSGGGLRAQLGLYRLAKDAAGETGGDFMTMRDNETLSGARDTAGGRGGFGAMRPAAFVPRMTNLRTVPSPAAARIVAAIEVATERFAQMLGLAHVFSLDFRVDAAGGATFLEFEVCPAVTIYDFQTYVGEAYGTTLGPALARAFRLAHAPQGGRAAV